MSQLAEVQSRYEGALARMRNMRAEAEAMTVSALATAASVATAGSAGFARGYMGEKYSILGVDPSLVAGTVLGLGGLALGGAAGSVVAGIGVGAVCESAGAAGFSQGAKMAAKNADPSSASGVRGSPAMLRAVHDGASRMTAAQRVHAAAARY